MTYYIYIKNAKIDGRGQCRQLNDGVVNLEVNKEQYDDFDKFIYVDGALVPDPDYEEKQKQKERERLNLLSLSKREVFLALYKAKGITPEQLKDEIEDVEALIEFEYANEYFRGNPLIDLIGAKLGYTADDLDYLFINKELPTEQVTEQVDEESERDDVE